MWIYVNIMNSDDFRIVQIHSDINMLLTLVTKKWNWNGAIVKLRHAPAQLHPARTWPHTEQPLECNAKDAWMNTEKKTRDWGCCAARLLGSTGRLGILSHKHIIYDSYDSVYCVTCLDLRSFISFLQGPAHKLRKRRMHRMHRMHWICKRFWSPKISKHLQTPSASNGHKLRSYAAMQLRSYAATQLGRLGLRSEPPQIHIPEVSETCPSSQAPHRTHRTP